MAFSCTQLIEISTREKEKNTVMIYICENQTIINIPSGCIKVAFHKINKALHILFFWKEGLISNALQNLKKNANIGKRQAKVKYFPAYHCYHNNFNLKMTKGRHCKPLQNYQFLWFLLFIGMCLSKMKIFVLFYKLLTTFLLNSK